MNSILHKILATGVRGSSILARGLGILHLVSVSSGASVKELADKSGLPLATTYRIVNQLRQAGFVVEYDGRIHAGAALATESSDGPHLVDHARPALKFASSETGLTAVLTVRVHTLALCLDVVSASRGATALFRIGETRALHAGASATPLLAFAADPIIENVIANGLRRYTSATPTEVELRTKLALIRQRGYDVSHGEVQPQWTGVGLPVFEHDNVYCCLSVTGPSARVPNPELLVPKLRECIEKLVRHQPLQCPLWNPTDPLELGA
ncbi:helix-turn-helix domain-containing protein [Micrococcales bacterium 31B]|nr:helix-turn-helix domain-containing protein [Micrococcales bacterium 31B]